MTSGCLAGSTQGWRGRASPLAPGCARLPLALGGTGRHLLPWQTPPCPCPMGAGVACLGHCHRLRGRRAKSHTPDAATAAPIPARNPRWTWDSSLPSRVFTSRVLEQEAQVEDGQDAAMRIQNISKPRCTRQHQALQQPSFSVHPSCFHWLLC